MSAPATCFVCGSVCDGNTTRYGVPVCSDYCLGVMRGETASHEDEEDFEVADVSWDEAHPRPNRP